MIELSKLRIGDKVEVKIDSTDIHNELPHPFWYKAEVVDKFYDELGDYVKLLIFPTTIFGEDKMILRNGKNLRWRLMNFT